MTTVTFIEFNGSRHSVQAAEGQSLMKAAAANNVPGIDAECGGACACATCHVYIDDTWCAKVGEPEGNEKDMLEFAVDVKESSRLSCQIVVTAALDGLVVSMPETQS